MHKTIAAACLSLLVAMPSAGLAAGHAGHDHAAHRPQAWTAYPLLSTRMSGGRRDMAASVVPQNLAADTVEAWSNDLSDPRGHRSLALEMAGARLDRPASGGFHWLAARDEQAGRVVVASTVHPFGERGAKDPTAMFLQQKHELDIVPQPFPREHSRYRANEEWKFLVRFNGAALQGQKVVMETSNGSKAEFMTDAQGVLRIRLPDDFKADEAGGAAGSRGRAGAEFVLATEHADSGRTYLTAFNGGYGTDAYDQRSLALGLGFTLLGMIGAAPLLRQRGTGRRKEGGHV